MTRILASMAALTMVAATVREDDKPRSPTGPQPMQVLARMDRDGNVVIRQTVSVYVPEQRQRTVQRDGRNVTEVYTVVRVTQREESRKLLARAIHVYGTNGKKIDKPLAKLLKKEIAVLLSVDGKPVDPFYLQLLKEGTLILVAPPPLPPPPELKPPPRQLPPPPKLKPPPPPPPKPKEKV